MGFESEKQNLFCVWDWGGRGGLTRGEGNGIIVVSTRKEQLKMNKKYNKNLFNRLYHRKVCWCESFDRLAKELFNKNYSYHLIHHDSNAKHDINFKKLDMIINELITNNRDYYLYEVETRHKNYLIKAVLRTSYDDNRDINIVFGKRDNNKLMVKTAWLNKKTDTHTTLDVSKYYKP